MKYYTNALFFLLLLLIFSCQHEEFIQCNQVVTYENQIKPIIDASCAYSGCHDGISASPGDYSSYSGIGAAMYNGLLEKRTVDIRDMPPVNSLGPKILSEEEMNLVKCWIEQGYLEK